MKFKKLLGALAVSSAFMAGTASAAPFTIDVGAFGSPGAGDTNTLTSLVYRLGLDWQATSNYTDNLANPFGGVGSLNIGDFVTDSGFGTIGLLNQLGGGITGSNNNEGIDDIYSLTFAYTNLVGIVNFIGDPGPTPSAIGAAYNTGTIQITANKLNPGDGTVTSSEQVMQLGVTGSTGTVGNFTLFTKILSVKEDMFFLNGVTDFDDILVIQAKDIAAVTDFNNPPRAVESLGGDPAKWTRNTRLSGDLTFNVPEPGALALLGLGLLGLAAVRRNKKAA